MKQKFLLSILKSRHLCLLLLAMCCCTIAMAQNVTVKGTVTSADDGKTLPGVTIKVKNTTTAVATVNGMYTISVAKGQTLVASFVGYTSQEIIVSDNTVIDFKLVPTYSKLSEVVVVGYGTQKKGSLTGSIASVSSKDIENQVQKHIMDAVAGQIAGVQVTGSTGRPGAAPVVRIRGASTISAGNGPLYVVDGLPLDGSADLNLINTEDIDRMDVLKGASAEAIYGSRGSNGVVQITTKKGKVGQSSINFGFYSGFQDVPKRIEMLNESQEVQWWKDASLSNWIQLGGDPTVPNGSRIYNGTKTYVNYLPSFDNPSSLPYNTDWQSVVLSNSAPISDYNMSAQGGTEKSTYFISGDYLSQDGVVKSSGMKRYTSRINLTSNINKYIRVGANIAPSYSLENVRNTDGHINSADGDADLILSALVQSNTLAPKIGNLYNGSPLNTAYNTVGYAAANNPLQIIESKDYINTVERLRLNGISYLEIEPIKGLVYHTDFGLNTTNTYSNKYRPSTISTVSGALPQQVGTVQSPVASNINNILSNHIEGRDINYNWNNTITWQKNIGLHDINILAGYTYQKAISEGSTETGAVGTFPNDAVKYVSGSTTIISTGSKSQWNLISYLGRINYAYNNKYLLSASIRDDGSSRFAVNNKFAVFPAASVGWRISEEKFLKPVTAISDLKIRVEYGSTGNFNIGNYASIAGLASDNYSFGNTLAPGYGPGGIGNADLRWETTKTKELGLDVGLLKNRITVTLDYYAKVTDGLLYSLPIPALTGFSSVLGNIGKIQNKGFEAELNTVNIDKKDLRWSSNFNISFNRNKVLALGQNNLPVVAGNSEGNFSQQRFIVGQPMDVFWGYKLGGVFKDAADLAAHPENRITTGGVLTGQPGDSKIVDVNGDGKITVDDQTVLGDPAPKFTYGFSNSVTYKNFSLDVLMQGVYGNKVEFLTARFIGTNTLPWNQLAESVLDRWVSPSQPGNGIYPKAGYSAVQQVGSTETQGDRWLRSGSYLRCRNVTLGYKLPLNLIRRIHMSSVQVFVTAENLFTVTNYVGYNPDVSVYGDTTSLPGIDYASYPLARTFTAGVKVGL